MSDPDHSNKSEAAKREERILAFWHENKIFEKSLEKESPKGEFVCYEGPPTTNGKPGIHHLEARAFKDLIPRYKTMQGYHVHPKAGWDTHGLPVELQVEKELGLNSKKEIEKYGIDKFNQKCKESVWTYVDLWKKFTERIGFWLDMQHPYVTYEASYIESVWNIIKKVHKRDLLYKDYRVVPWCTRCGTVLSSHELAQGYADTKDISVYVKFKVADEKNTYLLAWTTTPWTLPGNVALAVGKDITYVKAKVKGEKINGEEIFILAKERAEKVLGGYDFEILEEIKGKKLVGLSYEPIYEFLKENISESEEKKIPKAFKVYAAPFVTTNDGTGIVHVAPMYGTDDFELATKEKLPKFHVVKEDGSFFNEAGFLSGKFVKSEETNIDIIKDLHSRGILLKKENITHSYPFCWRCQTPLIYFARDSWYIRMRDVKEELVKENQDINWEPSYIKDGRFGEWLKEVKDWAISRERYWGTPLPIWKSEDGEEIEIIGGISDLKKYIKPRNRYFVMRHGEGEHNAAYVVSSDHHKKYHLTEKGRDDVALVAHTLVKENIDVIFTSPLTRTKETAEVIVETIGFKGEVIEDELISEYNFGDLDGRSFEEYHRYFSSVKEQLDRRLPNGENIRDVATRVGKFIYNVDKKYAGKTILIVTHDAPASVFFALAEGGHDKELINLWAGDFLPPGHVREFPFVALPHNENFELDLHRPFIDKVIFEKNGRIFKRIPEVLDVWFDSGSMPFAGDVNGPYPADFISEAIDQTRGWFYTLHAIGILMGKGKAYRNVICLGHILDKNGQKMSKSKGNTVDPWEMMDKYGADVLRFWMYSVNQPGESKIFDIETVEGVVKKVFNLLSNVVTFYEMYAGLGFSIKGGNSKHVMDIWIISLLNKLRSEVENNLNNYKVLEAARAIREFIADLSQWYIRNSRERFKSDSEEVKSGAISTTRYVLIELSKIMAPFTPFIAEDIYLRIGGEKESVHLEYWSKSEEVNEKILEQMKTVRSLVSEGLELRMKAGIKVRQPLQSFTFEISSEKAMIPEMLNVIGGELNVKKVIQTEKDSGEIKTSLDTKITPELKSEGIMKDLLREIQDTRKKENWIPLDKGILTIKSVLKEYVSQFETEIKKTAGISNISYAEIETDFELLKAKSN